MLDNLLRYAPHPCGAPFGPPAAFRSAILPIQSAACAPAVLD
jgi:hypothetical protein